LERLRKRGYFEISESVKAATTVFQESNDASAMFLEEECVREEGARVSGGKLYDDYKYWAERNGHRALSSTRMRSEWERLGLKRKRIKGSSYYEGVRSKLPSEKRDEDVSVG
jgi:phage/plasmid-associated DNA primase